MALGTDTHTYERHGQKQYQETRCMPGLKIVNFYCIIITNNSQHKKNVREKSHEGGIVQFTKGFPQY